jgi:hypothetical protein
VLAARNWYSYSAAGAGAVLVRMMMPREVEELQ